MAKGTILTSRKGGGSGYEGTSIYNEVPTGDKNHTNKFFKTFYPFVEGTLNVYYNGQRMGNVDYIEVGNDEFEFTYVKPYVVDYLMVDYVIQNL